MLDGIEVPNFQDYMLAIFSDMVSAAGRPELTSKLHTRDLPKDRKAEQFAKLGKLRPYGNEPLRLANYRFIARFKDEDRFYLCINTENTTSDAIVSLESALSTYNVIPDILDEAVFLFMALKFRGLYKPKPEFYTKKTASEIIDIANNDSYEGHEIDDLVNIFEGVSIYSISKDSVLASSGEWYIAAVIAAAHQEFRGGIISDSLAAKFISLMEIGNVNPENIYYSLTSVHWKHVFLEIYKCIEALYYLPWIISVRNFSGVTESGLTLIKKVRHGLKWKEKEKDSIEALFEMLDDAIVKDYSLLKTGPFKGCDFNEMKKSAIGRRIYTIRNTLVHQEDYEDNKPLHLTQECWPILVDYMIDFAAHAYRENISDAGFSYLLEVDVDLLTQTV